MTPSESMASSQETATHLKEVLRSRPCRKWPSGSPTWKRSSRREAADGRGLQGPPAAVEPTPSHQGHCQGLETEGAFQERFVREGRAWRNCVTHLS